MTIRAEYDRAAADYDRRWARYNRASLALLRPWIEGQDLGRVVDVACGTGNLLPLLAGAAGRMESCAAADFSAEMLRAARGKARGVELRAGFVAADALALPFRAASFETAVSASTLHYWKDPDAGLREIRRVLRTDGRLLLLDWWRDPPSMRLLNAWMRLARIEYHRMHSRAGMTEMLRAAGFRVEDQAGGSAGGPWRVIAFAARAV
ncbi:MAG TPA: methyltransferase domain-containing protein [Longimicrobium sp.]|nr:methyltransferase domain-containing protein [Longimicrobium sp.]